jgi:hypothetical protein
MLNEGFDRRLMMQRALLLLGAVTTSLPSVALAAPSKRAKSYLSASLIKVLSAIADTVIPRTETPGALDVKVPALLDAMLVNWATPKRRAEIVQAIAKVDALSITTTGKDFAGLTPEERTTILKAHEKEAMKTLPNPKGSGIASLLAGPVYADPGYGKLKELIVLLYYVSEPALTQELSYVHAPGAWQPSIPVTPDTRPAAGGLF